MVCSMNKTSTTSFICSLNGNIQKLIYLELVELKKEYKELDILEAMSGRLCDLEELIDVKKFLN